MYMCNLPVRRIYLFNLHSLCISLDRYLVPTYKYPELTNYLSCIYTQRVKVSSKLCTMYMLRALLYGYEYFAFIIENSKIGSTNTRTVTLFTSIAYL